MSKYLIRFDDITPKMDWDRFKDIMGILKSYKIKSILGVIPDSKDLSLNVSKGINNYIEYLLDCRDNGDIIAQHGLNHIYDSNSSGMYGTKNYSEFAGHSFHEQYKRLQKGKSILMKYNLWQPYFMAPSHSFDYNTIKALKELEFKYITDGIGLYPYTYQGITFIPQFYSKPLPKIIPGISQLCIHINTISNSDLLKLKEFIRSNSESFITTESALRMKEKSKFALFSRKLLEFSVPKFKSIKSII